MPKVAEHRAVNLVQVQPNSFALQVVGLVHVDGNQPVDVTGHDLVVVVARHTGTQELERDASFLILLLADDGQAEPLEAVNEATFTLAIFL